MAIEQLQFQYKAERGITKKGHVGAVTSGDLEILIEPFPIGIAQVDIRTQTEGFGPIWQAIFDRFFEAHPIAVHIQINDFGATPGVVNLRLAQVAEVIE